MVYLQPDGKNQDVYRDSFEFTMAANSSNPEESSLNQEVSNKSIFKDYNNYQLTRIIHI